MRLNNSVQKTNFLHEDLLSGPPVKMLCLDDQLQMVLPIKSPGRFETIAMVHGRARRISAGRAHWRYGACAWICLRRSSWTSSRLDSPTTCMDELARWPA